MTAVRNWPDLSDWRPIETAPKDERVLTYFSDGDMLLCCAADWKRDEGDDYWPIYWMPLPSPPERRSGDERG